MVAVADNKKRCRANVAVGFTTAFDRASNKFYERHLHAENRSHLYEQFDANNLPMGRYDSLDRLLQYQRGTLASTGGDGGNGGGSVADVITLPGTDTQRSYQLDSLGNWRNTVFTPQTTGVQQTETRQHNGLNEITRIANPLATSTLILPTYDANGNMTFDGNLSYAWDALNRMAAASNGETPVGVYNFDAFNRRIRKNVSDVLTDCIYSGWRCIEDRNPAAEGGDAPIAQYLWGIYLDEIIQMLPTVDTNGFAANSPLYPLQDLLYRTIGVADSEGVVREAYDLDAYGTTIIFRNAGTPPAQVTFADTGTFDSVVSVPTCPFIFTGQRFDPETGLYFVKRRFYKPALGRFLSKDFLRWERGDSRFGYCNSNPTALTDPVGLEVVSIDTKEILDRGFPGESYPAPENSIGSWIFINASSLNQNCNYHWVQFLWFELSYLPKGVRRTTTINVNGLDKTQDTPQIDVFGAAFSGIGKKNIPPVTGTEVYVDTSKDATSPFADETTVRQMVLRTGNSLGFYDAPSRLLYSGPGDKVFDQLENAVVSANGGKEPATMTITRHFRDYLVTTGCGDGKSLNVVLAVTWSMREIWDFKAGAVHYSGAYQIDKTRGGDLRLWQPKGFIDPAETRAFENFGK